MDPTSYPRGTSVAVLAGMRNAHRLACCLLVATLPACAEDQVENPCIPRVPAEVDKAGERHQYVVDTLDLPETPMASQALGLDLDGDSQGRPDNLLGSILATISIQQDGYSLDGEAKLLIDAGEILHLIEVQTVSLDDAEGVGVFIAHGVDMDGDPTDNFLGTEPFARDPRRGDGLLSGRIEGRHLSVELGSAPVAVTFPGLDEPFVLELRGARIEAEITPDTIQGRIGGAIPVEEVDTLLIPAFYEGLSRVVARDCPAGTCVNASFGELLMSVFDHDEDGTFTIEEFREDDLTISLLSPDVDLIDSAGQAARRCDGVKDGLSVGLGFHAVRASFP